MASPASRNFATSFSLPGLASKRTNRETLYIANSSEIRRPSRPTWPATTEQGQDRQSCILPAEKRRSGLFGILVRRGGRARFGCKFGIGDDHAGPNWASTSAWLLHQLSY